LKDGALEQVASPREIYAHPATSYTAQFIGQTNLLRTEVKSGVARWGSLQWGTSRADGASIFSLRPEAIHWHADSVMPTGAVRFRAAIRQQIFSGDSEQLELDFEGHVLKVRLHTMGLLSGEQEFWFSPLDAVGVRE
jgi:ABC-type Fe3+/spermidine/putrescine transport system ATPase subunit